MEADTNSSTLAAAQGAQGTAADELGLLENQIRDMKLDDYKRVDVQSEATIDLVVKHESKFYDDANDDLKKQFEGV